MQRVGPSRPTIARRRSLIEAISFDIGHSIFCALWWIMLCFLTTNTAFLSLLAKSYLSYLDADSKLRNIARDFLFSKQMKFLEQNHIVIGLAYAVIAFPFAVFVARMLWYTIIRRRLAFGPAHRSATRASKHRIQRQHQCCASAVSKLLHVLARYSIGGAQFMSLIVVSKTIEVFIQFCQGFQASKIMSDPVFSQIYGTMILVNCCSTPLIMYCCEKTKQSAKAGDILCAVTNSFLAFTWGTMVQGLLFFRYLRYNKNQQWSNLVPETYERELGYVLVLSPENFVFSTFTFITSGVAMFDCVRALNDDGQPHESFISSKSPRTPMQVMPAQPDMTAIRTMARPTTSPFSASGGPFLRWWSAFIIWFGGCVFVVAMGATGKIWRLNDSDVPCLDQIYPWFVSDVACVGRKINCTQFHISGKKTELDAVLHTFSTHLLSNLAIVDCPALEMPASIQSFNDLETLTVMNTTVLLWDSTAAIDDRHFPILKTLSLHSVEFASVPSGFVSQPLPASFEWMYASDIDVDMFVDVVGDNWSMTVYFQCRFCHLRRIPAVVYNMSKLQAARFENNSIQSIEEEAFAKKPELTFLSLNGNPLSKLPASVWSLLGQLWFLEVEFTNVSTIPEIAVAAAATNEIVVIQAAGTPLCTGNQTQLLLPSTKLFCKAYAKGW